MRLPYCKARAALCPLILFVADSADLAIHIAFANVCGDGRASMPGDFSARTHAADSEIVREQRNFV
jgi:hypothetical protein